MSTGGTGGVGAAGGLAGTAGAVAGTAGTGGLATGGSAGTAAGGSGAAGVGGSGGAPPLACDAVETGHAPLRRLTTYEFNNTIRDLLGDDTSPGDMLPPQTDSKDNWFGNDALFQSVDDTLVEKYLSIAESIAARATADLPALGRLHACAGVALAAEEEEACARSIATSLLPRAYRRVPAPEDIDEAVAVYTSVRALSPTLSFASGVAGMLEWMLQSPDFLYRVELGTEVAGNAAVKRVTGREMATRLSYLFFQSMPDPALFQAADEGALDTDEGVRSKASQLLDDPRSRPMVGFFFDNLLPIPDLAGLSRDSALFPTWSASIGAAMRTEVQKMLEHEIYDNAAQNAPPYVAGSWPAILTAPYTFVDSTLFAFYGADTFAPGTSVTGPSFQRVELNTTQRLGLLTLGGVMAGGTTSNKTNPVLRGTFLLNRLMCEEVELPTGFTPPQVDPYSGKTARERVAAHTAQPVCAGCHAMIDPMGLPFENYDAVGLYRTTETWTDPMTQMVYETPIDASGSVPNVEGTAANALELARLLASAESVQSCFAGHWMQFAYGRSLEAEDACNRQSVQTSFAESGYNVKQLLLALTQTDAFLYRPVE